MLHLLGIPLIHFVSASAGYIASSYLTKKYFPNNTAIQQQLNVGGGVVSAILLANPINALLYTVTPKETHETWWKRHEEALKLYSQPKMVEEQGYGLYLANNMVGIAFGMAAAGFKIMQAYNIGKEMVTKYNLVHQNQNLNCAPLYNWISIAKENPMLTAKLALYTTSAMTTLIFTLSPTTVIARESIVLLNGACAADFAYNIFKPQINAAIQKVTPIIKNGYDFAKNILDTLFVSSPARSVE
jgi:hypothetical protein